MLCSDGYHLFVSMLWCCLRCCVARVDFYSPACSAAGPRYADGCLHQTTRSCGKLLSTRICARSLFCRWLNLRKLLSSEQVFYLWVDGAKRALGNAHAAAATRLSANCDGFVEVICSGMVTCCTNCFGCFLQKTSTVQLLFAYIHCVALARPARCLP